jgi:hypothetical protein
MRARKRRLILAVIAAISPILYLACSDSNDVSSPGPRAAPANVAGTWSGMFQSDSASLCASAPASAQFSQQGNRVTGSFKALDCGITGAFHGFVDGNTLSGTVDMVGCTGGIVSGRVEGATISFTVGAFTKSLVTEDREVLPGGRATLER